MRLGFEPTPGGPDVAELDQMDIQCPDPQPGALDRSAHITFLTFILPVHQEILS